MLHSYRNAKKAVLGYTHSDTIMTTYILTKPGPPWHDYGDILVHGMSAHLDRHDGLIQLERTGPFVPPMSFPGITEIVVTDTLKHDLERMEFTGLMFFPVIKARIVHIDWHLWSAAADEPAEYSASGEPEDYILERPHDPELAAAIGDLWEVRVPVTPESSTLDLFTREGQGDVYVSDAVKHWLEQRVGQWVQFKPARVDEGE